MRFKFFLGIHFSINLIIVYQIKYMKAKLDKIEVLFNIKTHALLEKHP